MTNSYSAISHSRRKPRQGRSKALVDAICQSCLKIINSGCGDQLSVSLIIKTAGVTKSSFYQYFPNVDTVIGYALANYDRGDGEEDFFFDEKLKEKVSKLSLTESIDLLVNAACDRHVRLLRKYGNIYRRFHRNFVPTRYFYGENNDTSENKELREFLYCLLDGNQPSFKTCSVETVIFLMVTTIVEFTGKAIDLDPRLVEEESFRNTLSNFLTSYLQKI